VLSEPATQTTVVAFPLRRRWQRAALPLAACLALVAGIAGYFMGQSAFGPASSPLGAIAYGDPAVIEALERTPANAPLKLQAGGAGAATLQIAGSYPVDGGYCRVFSLSSGADSVRGLGCKRGAGWTIEAVAADVAANETGRYRPASGATDLIEAALDSFGAGEPVAPEEEKGLIAVAWKK
jgi:hypothetical protein